MVEKLDLVGDADLEDVGEPGDFGLLEPLGLGRPELFGLSPSRRTRVGPVRIGEGLLR